MTSIFSKPIRDLGRRWGSGSPRARNLQTSRAIMVTYLFKKSETQRLSVGSFLNCSLRYHCDTSLQTHSYLNGSFYNRSKERDLRKRDWRWGYYTLAKDSEGIGQWWDSWLMTWELQLWLKWDCIVAQLKDDPFAHPLLLEKGSDVCYLWVSWPWVLLREKWKRKQNKVKEKRYMAKDSQYCTYSLEWGRNWERSHLFPSNLQPSLWSEQECLSSLIGRWDFIYNIRENYKQSALLRLRNSSNKTIFCKKGKGNWQSHIPLSLFKLL